MAYPTNFFIARTMVLLLLVAFFINQGCVNGNKTSPSRKVLGATAIGGIGTPMLRLSKKQEEEYKLKAKQRAEENKRNLEKAEREKRPQGVTAIGSIPPSMLTPSPNSLKPKK